MKILKGKCAIEKHGGEELTVGFDSRDCEPDISFQFAIVPDDDGEKHFGINLTEEKQNEYLEHIKHFYSKGMIPWICPSCGRFYGGHYDVGSMRWFQCHFCGAEWELKNGEELDKYTESEERKLKIHALN